MLLSAYRRTGAELPLRTPEGYHGTGLEGWFWRIVEPGSGAVVVVIAAVCRDGAGGRWGMAALAAHPSGEVRVAQSDDVETDPGSAFVRVGSLLRADARGLRVDLGPDARLGADLAGARGWGRGLFGGLGPAQAVPGLSQYWHPHLLHATATGDAVVGTQSALFAGAPAYAEKNWGAGGMPDTWWWGQAHVPDPGQDGPVAVAFAGGPAGIGPVRVRGTALVVAGAPGSAVGGPHRFVAPLQRLHVRAAADGWHLAARSARTSVEVVGHPSGAPIHLPVPLPRERRVLRSHTPQHLAARVEVEVRRGGRTIFAGETAYAGLEVGTGAED